MEVPVLRVGVVVLLLYGKSFASPATYRGDVELGGSGNGWPSFLPVTPDASYNIRLSEFRVDPPKKSDCLLGNANNYLPWLMADGRLTVHGQDRAIDLSNLGISEEALELLVRNLSATVPLHGVRYLSVARNALTAPPAQLLSNLPGLEFLSLEGNNFQASRNENDTSSYFPTLSNLTTLDLRNCSIRTLSNEIFENLTSLQYLFLSYNRISHLSMDLFRPLKSLVHLDLSYMYPVNSLESVRMTNPFMKLIAGMELDQFLFYPLVKLRFLDLSYTRLEFKSFIALSSIRDKLQYVSYCYIGLPALMDYLFHSKRVKMLDISGNDGIPRTISRRSFNQLKKSLEVLYFTDAMVQRLDWVSTLTTLEVLNLRDNIVGVITQEDLHSMRELQVLDLSNNYIMGWNRSIFEETVKLQAVNLRHNKIIIMTSEMQRDLLGVQQFGLGGNTIQCSCNYVFLLEHIFSNDTVREPEAEQPQLFDFNAEDYNCLDFSNKERVSPFDYPYCKRQDDSYSNVSQPETADDEDALQDYTTVYVLVGVTVVIVVCSVVAITYWWFHIKYFFVILKNSAILSFFNDDKLYLDKSGLLKQLEFHYDVFVSYSNNDRDWVLDQLLPNMEGVSQINLCLHERDFEVGYGILENIISCMDRSRCLMLIVSESFLLSHWCQFEMHLAQHRLLETRREELILVLLQEIPKRKCPKTLSYLLKTKTYIKWPSESSKEQLLFWRRLHKTLLTSKC